MRCMRSARMAGILLVSFGASAFLFGCGQNTSASLQKSLTSIAVTPISPSIAKGLTEQYTATGTYSDASTQNLTSQATWTSSNTAVATISAAGLASGAGTGSTAIEASLNGINGSIGLTVTPAALQSMAVTPANPSIPKGLSEQYTAMGTYSDASTQNLTSQATWTSSNTAVATIIGSGLANGVGAGSATIEASLNGVRGPTGLTVTPATLRSIAVTPPNPSIAKGLTEQYTATGTFNDGSTLNLTSQATWTLSNPSVATISASGLANGAGAGSTTIEASLNGMNGLTGLTVTPAVLQSIAVTPANPSIAVGLTEQYTATGTYSDTSTQNLTSQASWTSSNTSVATISSGGLASGAGTGSATIEASLSGVNGSTGLTVTPAALQSIAITPPNAAIPNGTTEQFAASRHLQRR